MIWGVGYVIVIFAVWIGVIVASQLPKYPDYDYSEATFIGAFIGMFWPLALVALIVYLTARRMIRALKGESGE